MGDASELAYLLMAAAGVVLMIVVVQWRRRSHGEHVREVGEREVCEHLRPALELLLRRGQRIRRVGQHHPELPLEIHLDASFSPREVYEELGMAEPVFVSERNVLYCKEDWCELHPAK